jgi:hypothetical protein
MSGKENKENNDNVEQSSEDFLKKYLDETDVNRQSETRKDIKINEIKSDATQRASDLQYFHFEVANLPLGKFYPSGTTIMVRPSMVKEIQAYSMVEDNNFPDMVQKMNDMIASCVRVKYSDGSMGSYLDVKDGDRFYLIFLIRELTFQKGNVLTLKNTCSCGEQISVELSRKTFVHYDMEEDIEPYFNLSTKEFEFETINGDMFQITPPNIGIQKSFTDYILKQFEQKKTPNMSFLKIIPFTLHGRNNITQDGIDAKLKEFQDLDLDSFQFLNGAVNKMKFGIKELKSPCTSCGMEVHTEMSFPNGASGIFVDAGSFDRFIKK